MQIFTRTVIPITKFISIFDEVIEKNGYWDENEQFTDGNQIYDEGEEYEDGNDTYDFKDIDGDGKCDFTGSMEAGNFTSNECEPFTDSNNGQYDPWETYVDGNGQYDFGEEYEDGNLQYDFGEEYTDSENGQYDPWENFTDSGNGLYEPWEDFIDEPSSRYYRKLNWEKTLEPQTSESAYVIYRVIQDSLDYLLTPEICDCTIDTISSFLTNFYDDNDSLVLITENPLGYYYRIKVLKDGFEKFSFINYADWPNPEKINLTQDNVSTNKENYVKMTWDPIQNQTYFYQYEIYQTIGHPSTANDTSLIAIIEDPNLNHFLAEKRSAGIGQTCYYSIATVDVSGKREYSNFIKGLTKP